jgi:hypothetical protein
LISTLALALDLDATPLVPTFTTLGARASGVSRPNWN